MRGCLAAKKGSEALRAANEARWEANDTKLASKTHHSSTMYVGWNQVMTRKSSDEFIAEVSRRRGTLLFDI